MLAPVHRSMPLTNGDTTTPLTPAPRESERDEWWRPRAEEISRYIATTLSKSDIILLQEWWFDPQYSHLFDAETSHLFTRVSERRPGRDDGMAVLINKKSSFTLLQSRAVLTGPQRIGQIVTCRCETSHRIVCIANAHLSFPGNDCAIINERRQACEVQLVARALMKQSQGMYGERGGDGALHILGGDFNSHAAALPARLMEGSPFGFVNCVSACSLQSFASGSGGQVELGVTHHTHRGEDVCVDHVFVRVDDSSGGGGGGRRRQSNAAGKQQQMEGVARRMGYLDGYGTRIVSYLRGDLRLDGWEIISDHRPVTVNIDWPERVGKTSGGLFAGDTMQLMEEFNAPLDPLEPPSWWEG